jgi:hypothetical protein
MTEQPHSATFASAGVGSSNEVNYHKVKTTTDEMDSALQDKDEMQYPSARDTQEHPARGHKDGKGRWKTSRPCIESIWERRRGWGRGCGEEDGTIVTIIQDNPRPGLCRRQRDRQSCTIHHWQTKKKNKPTNKKRKRTRTKEEVGTKARGRKRGDHRK